MMLGLLTWCLLSPDVDLEISRWFFDASSQAWPWRSHWLTQDVAHRGGKYLIVMWGLTLIACLGLSVYRTSLRAWRRTWAYILTCLVISVSVTGVWKANSRVPCPWDVAEFEGGCPHQAPFHPAVAGSDCGGCFPAGHASGAFALFGLYFVARARHRRRAWIWILPGFCLGNLFGLTQVMRGAHFVSHQIYTGAMIWILCALVFIGVFRARV